MLPPKSTLFAIMLLMVLATFTSSFSSTQANGELIAVDGNKVLAVMGVGARTGDESIFPNMSIGVDIGNAAPVADAGPDQSVRVGATVTLTGSGSIDDDGDPLAYSWTLTGPDLVDATGSLTGADTAGPSFLADREGEYVASLVVNDGTADSTPDTVSIRVTDDCPGGVGKVAELETAINDANLDPGLDTITLANNCSYTLTTVLPDIGNPITIEGNGNTIDGNAAFRVFLVTKLDNLTMNDLDLTNGVAGSGGGGAILSAGTVTLNGASSIYGNTATTSSGGGGIRNNGGTVTLNDASSVYENTATSKINNNGGGIRNNEGVVILNGTSSIHDNTTAGSGGGIRNDGGDSTVILNGASSIYGNTATNSSSGAGGGGISNNGGTVVLSGAASIHDNTTASNGGGIRNDAGGAVTLIGTINVRNNNPDDIFP
jgi:hypothetical protein